MNSKLEDLRTVPVRIVQSVFIYLEGTAFRIGLEKKGRAMTEKAKLIRLIYDQYELFVPSKDTLHVCVHLRDLAHVRF